MIALSLNYRDVQREVYMNFCPKSQFLKADPYVAVGGYMAFFYVALTLDVEAGGQLAKGPHRWRFVDSLGRSVPIAGLAKSANDTGRTITLTYLRPTTKDLRIRGMCVVFSETRRRFYSSLPFEVIVKRKGLVDEEGKKTMFIQLMRSRF